MKKLVLLALLLVLVTMSVNANTIGSSTIYFQGNLTDNGDGTFSGVLPVVVDGGFDVYGEEGSTAWFGDNPGSGPVWTSVLIGADHDAWSTWTPDTPDWYQYSIKFYEESGVQKWALRNHPGATAVDPWYNDPVTYPPKGVPMSGIMDWSQYYAYETEVGEYLPATGTPEIPGGTLSYGGGAQAWDMDWSWGSEVVPLEYPGFKIVMTPNGGGVYHIRFVPAPIPTSIGSSVDVGISVGVEQFAPRIWMDPNTRLVLDDNIEPGVAPDLIERVENYAFTGEQIQWDVVVWDKNGVEKISDVYVRLNTSINTPDDIEANCRESNTTGLPFSVWEGEENVTWNPQTMRWYTCTLTVEPQWHGEYFVAAVVTDLNGLWDEFAENEFWFMNPVIALGLSGGLDFGTVRPGATVLSDTLVLSNQAEAGSGVLLDMYIAGTDFYDAIHSGAACPTSNVLRLTNFRYYASNGAYTTCANPGTDGQCYDDIPYYQDGAGAAPNNNFARIIDGPLVLGGYYPAGNVLSPGADISLNFKLNMPEPCNSGPFTSGEIKFYGEAI